MLAIVNIVGGFCLGWCLCTLYLMEITKARIKLYRDETAAWKRFAEDVERNGGREREPARRWPLEQAASPSPPAHKEWQAP